MSCRILTSVAGYVSKYSQCTYSTVICHGISCQPKEDVRKSRKDSPQSKVVQNLQIILSHLLAQGN